MDFFEHQDQARRNTTKLIVLFGVAIAAMVMAFYVVAWVMLHDIAPGYLGLFNPGLFLMVASATLGIIAFGTITKMVELRRGGPAVAESLGGKEVPPQTTDFKEKQLLNVVAEMALASGTPVPKVYLLAKERGINAFAAGYSPDDAVIGVTHGCLDQLTREELQGVIAHEFSHILNGDMRLNLKLMGVLQGLLFIYILGRTWTDGAIRSHHDNDDEGGRVGGVLIGLSMLVVGGIGLFFGRIIKSGVSRQREFLADASSVQFTRNPDGLAGALRRIGGFANGSQLRSPKAEEASHMFFGEALNSSFISSWMATHPPLNERIRRITGLAIEGGPRLATATLPGFTEEPIMGFQGGLMNHQDASVSASNEGATSPNLTNQFMAAVGTATPQQLAKAHNFLQSLPPDLGDALQSPEGAMALIYGMLLDQQLEVRSRQLALFHKRESLVDPDQVKRLSDLMHGMDAYSYLPLLDLSVPVLRTITPQQCARFFKDIQALVRADGRLTLSEYVLQIILQKRLRPYFQKNLEHPKAVTNLDAVWQDCQVLLTVLARIGHPKSEDAFYAFKSGVYRLPGANKRELPQALPNVTLSDLGKSLKHLEPAVPKLKQSIVDAAAHTVLVDNTVTPREAELLRAIVISLDCPMPPFLEAMSKKSSTVKSSKGRKATTTLASRNGHIPRA